MFANSSLKAHLMRGILGISLFFGACLATLSYPLLAMSLTVSGLIILRGCPMCWTMGLLEKLTLAPGDSNTVFPESISMDIV